MSKITIDGVSYVGNSVSIRNGVVTIDGVVQDATKTGVVKIQITEGVLQQLETDASVECGDVHGSVHAGGSVSCDDVGGSVSAGGSVSCDDVEGSVVAGGSISRS